MIGGAAVEAALDRVVDPCSNAMGEPLGLREMGLATHVTIDEDAGSVHVTMRLTSPCCAYGPTMAVAARREIEQVPGVRLAVVDIDHAAMWTPEDIHPGASERLTVRRRNTIEVSGVRSHDWTTWNDEPI